MNKTLSISIPHRLGQEEATKRLQSGIAEMKTKFAGQIANVEDTWTGNTMTFRFAVMGQSVTGRADVLPDAVKLDIDLPWMLAMLADKIRPKVEQEGRKLLEKN